MKVNLCSGGDYREGYLNVDFTLVRSDTAPIKVDLMHDICEGLPWDSNSVEEVVFRESLEHFNKSRGFLILNEIYRVLQPEGKLDLSVPNAPRQLKALLMHVNRSVTFEEFMNPHQAPWGYYKFHEDLMGATHALSKGDSHLALYTRPVLEMLLRKIGFIIESFEEGSSFYVIARKS